MHKPCIDCLNEGRRGFAEYRGRCKEHAAKRERQTHKAEHRKVYQSKKWRNTRKKMLGLCVDCGKAVGEEIDHIVPLEQGGAPYHPDNLAPRCKSCHAKKTRREQLA